LEAGHGGFAVNALNPFSGPFVLDPAELPSGSVWVVDEPFVRTFYVRRFGSAETAPVVCELKRGFWERTPDGAA